MGKMKATVLLSILILSSAYTSSAQNCGSQAGGAVCSGCLCCSQYGYCGSTNDHCGAKCQSQCGTGGVASLVSASLFNKMLLHRDDTHCEGHGFYTYDAFVAAANSFSCFARTGDVTTRKKEIAAFLGQTSHETTGGWPTALDGTYAWGYCFLREKGNSTSGAPPGDYCRNNTEWPCAPGKKYYGRGPIQISYNYNYGPAGKAINVDLLNNPDLVASNPTVSFKTALWFWMTPQSVKPSCHDVATGTWTPSSADISAGRRPGYGMITNIINGGVECGPGKTEVTKLKVVDRIGFYKRYCDLLGVDYGDNLDCYSQTPFGYKGTLYATM